MPGTTPSWTLRAMSVATIIRTWRAATVTTVNGALMATSFTTINRGSRAASTLIANRTAGATSVTTTVIMTVGILRMLLSRWRSSALHRSASCP
ncbi:hypothetical protein PR003_g13036 [Phytophthora rubi]|uniref:Uncharacterized protein n=2 Tax=Phytophthora TaxID=4783 RepID=A0A6A4DSD9_9STRA|nr:hypothetical protein PF009_g11355 [Phytophthora fragariae]KAE9019535.1 hypothetical protein PR002_g12777 [Phytophthora rubi]KAE9312125.1 hypothetical protein PF001_g9392 [Phytophthora fragariae]KAE9335383.1 hypothetical protein PR003_g13036 [Phytophthora rubi]KAE9344102.1 hypothetical protein PF008_g9380 [Phytophthora fragariae]